MKVLISAGPTREKIDPIRFVSNRSSGKMGYALAAAAQAQGGEVILVSGPTTLTPPDGVTFVAVESAAEMAQAVISRAASCDVIIMAAAVAYYRPKTVFAQKMKKSSGDLVIEFERTQDILATLGQQKTDRQLLVGFAAETENLLANAQGKLQRKNLDYIVANSASKGFGSETNTVTLLGRNGEVIPFASMLKVELANRLIRHFFNDRKFR